MARIQPDTFTISSRSIHKLFKSVNGLVQHGNALTRLWYEVEGFIFRSVTYYAEFKIKKPTLEIIIGPVTTRDLPKPPKPPTLEIIIGPVTTRDLPKPPKLEFIVGPISNRELDNARSD